MKYVVREGLSAYLVDNPGGQHVIAEVTEERARALGWLPIASNDRATIVGRYLAGESAPAIAHDYRVTAPFIWRIVAEETRTSAA